MLPRPRRVTRPEEFRAVLRRGRRAGRRRLVVHALPGGEHAAHPARAGLVVGKAVGPSVTRHRVSRRLRHLLRERLEGVDAVAAGTDLVVRAQPAAADASSRELAEDLDAALARLGLRLRSAPPAPRR